MTETHSTMYFIDKAKKEKKKESLLSLEHSRFFNQSISLPPVISSAWLFRVWWHPSSLLTLFTSLEHKLFSHSFFFTLSSLFILLHPFKKKLRERSLWHLVNFFPLQQSLTDSLIVLPVFTHSVWQLDFEVIASFMKIFWYSDRINKSTHQKIVENQKIWQRHIQMRSFTCNAPVFLNSTYM